MLLYFDFWHPDLSPAERTALRAFDAARRAATGDDSRGLGARPSFGGMPPPPPPRGGGGLFGGGFGGGSLGGPAAPAAVSAAPAADPAAAVASPAPGPERGVGARNIFANLPAASAFSAEAPSSEEPAAALSATAAMGSLGGLGGLARIPGLGGLGGFDVSALEGDGNRKDARGAEGELGPHATALLAHYHDGAVAAMVLKLQPQRLSLSEFKAAARGHMAWHWLGLRFGGDRNAIHAALKEIREASFDE